MGCVNVERKIFENDLFEIATTTNKLQILEQYWDSCTTASASVYYLIVVFDKIVGVAVVVVKFLKY